VGSNGRVISRFLLVHCSAILAAAQTIESRGRQAWPTANHFRIRVERIAPVDRPIFFSVELPASFNPDSVRVVAEDSSAPLPAKVEWQRPNARLMWLSSGAAAYYISFDEGTAGETQRGPEPAMIGAGDRITYGRPGVRGRLATQPRDAIPRRLAPAQLARP